MKRKKKIKESLLLHISLRSSRMEAEEKKTRIFFLENLFSLSFFSFLSLSRKKESSSQETQFFQEDKNLFSFLVSSSRTCRSTCECAHPYRRDDIYLPRIFKHSLRRSREEKEKERGTESPAPGREIKRKTALTFSLSLSWQKGEGGMKNCFSKWNTGGKRTRRKRTVRRPPRKKKRKKGEFIFQEKKNILLDREGV